MKKMQIVGPAEGWGLLSGGNKVSDLKGEVIGSLRLRSWRNADELAKFSEEEENQPNEGSVPEANATKFPDRRCHQLLCYWFVKWDRQRGSLYSCSLIFLPTWRLFSNADEEDFGEWEKVEKVRVQLLGGVLE